MGFDAVGQDEVGAGVEGLGVVEQLTDGSQRAGAAGSRGRVERDVDLAVGDVQVAGAGERFADEASGFVVRAGVVGGDQPGQSRLGVVGRDQ